MSVFGPSTVAQDVEEQNAGSPLNDGTYLARIEIGRNSANTWHGGFRWTGVNVPQGATITTAKLDVLIIPTVWAGYVVGVYCEDADNAAAFSGSHRPSQVTPTTAKSTISASDQTIGTAQTTVPITVTSLVQEIVDRTGWSNGNAMNFVMLNEAGGAGAYDYFAIDNVDGGYLPENPDPPVGATLTITYTASATGRIMSSLAAAGGLAGVGGIAGHGGGLAA